MENKRVASHATYEQPWTHSANMHAPSLSTGRLVPAHSVNTEGKVGVRGRMRPTWRRVNPILKAVEPMYVGANWGKINRNSNLLPEANFPG